MKRSLIVLTFLWGSAQAATPNMYFSCSGVLDGASYVLLSKAYKHGEWQGLIIDRRAIYEEELDQRIDSSVVMAKQPIDSTDPTLRGLEKYTYDTSSDRKAQRPVYDWKTGKRREIYDFSRYIFIIPSKIDLEKIWRAPSDPEENGRFIMHLELKTNKSDKSTIGRLNCLLNWKI